MPAPEAVAADPGAVPLSEQDLLALWETGEGRHNADKALLTLALANPDAQWEHLVRLPLGARDRMLLELRSALLGKRIPIGVQCPRCQERLEFDTSADELLANLPRQVPSLVVLEAAGFRIRARPLDSRDLVNLRPGMTRRDGRILLVRQAVLDAMSNTTRVAPEELPAEAIAALADKLAEADPAADLEFALDCPACSHAWVATLDITAYFWHELTGLARAMLEGVHELAAAYGWAERDILDMSKARRAFYLSRISP